MPFPVVDADSVPWLTIAQMRDVDRVAEQVGLNLARMMENAGASVAALTRALLGGDVAGAWSR